MNNNENISISKLLAVLDIQDDESFIITNVELIDDKNICTFKRSWNLCIVLDVVQECILKVSILVSLIIPFFRIPLNFI